MPMRYPTRSATDDPRPRPGGLSSKGSLREGEGLLFHDLLGDQAYLPVEEQEPRQLVSTYQPELLFQPGLDSP